MAGNADGQSKSLYFGALDQCRYTYLVVRFKDGSSKIIEKDDTESWNIMVSDNVIKIKVVPYKENEYPYEIEVDLNDATEAIVKSCWICGGCDCSISHNPDGVECGHEEYRIYL